MRALFVTLTLIVTFCLAVTERALALPSGQELMMWKGIKAGLLGADDDRYFEQIHDALLPTLSGTVTSVLQNEGLSRVVVAIIDDVTPEVTLIVHNGSRKLARDLKKREVSFQGVVNDFSRSPFMLTLDLHESVGILEDK